MGAAAAAAAAAAGLLLGRRGTGFGFLLLLPTSLEIRGIPARALELESRRGDQLLEFGLATVGAAGQRRVAHFLNDFKPVATGPAFVFVNRHTEPPEKQCAPKIMGAVDTADKMHYIRVTAVTHYF